MNAATPNRATLAAGLRPLLFGRWHFSSRLVAVLTFAMVVVANLPGNVANHVNEIHEMGYYSGLVPQYEHGWPLTYIVRQEDSSFGFFGLTFSFSTVAKCWKFWDLKKQDEFRPFQLAGNIVVGLSMVFLTGCGFEIWRRRHRSLLQVHLFDVGLAITLLAGVLGWYVAARSTHEREQSALADFVDERTEHGLMRSTMSAVEVEQRGPTWVRQCVGNKHFEFLDRVVAASPLPKKGISSLAVFRNLRKTSLEFEDPAELSQLSQFRQLEELIVTLRLPTEPGSSVTTIRFPPLRNLKVLSIRSLDDRATGLDQLTNLRVLDLRGTFATAESLEEIGRLQKLKRLTLPYCSFPPEAIAHLRSLRELEELDLDETAINDAGAAWLTELPALRDLSLRNSLVTKAGLLSLAGSRSLESLSLGSLTESDLRTLSSSRKLRLVRAASPEQALQGRKSIHGWSIHHVDDSWIFYRKLGSGK